ncbi:MAG: PadR family transcriptional regulator [Acidimicrobiales bacterium]
MFNEDSSNPRNQGPDGPRGLRRRGGPGHGHGGPGGRFRGAASRRGDGRRQRGDVRAAVLVLLEEQARNGYQLIQELTERSNEAWRPSPGSIYPVLQQLEDEGLVEISAGGTGRTYELSDAGRALVTEQRDQLGKPWENSDLDTTGAARELMGTARDVLLAARQVLVAGSSLQVTRATTILVETRRSLYGILAEGEDA